MKPALSARKAGNAVAVSGAVALLPLVRVLPVDWRLFNDGDITFYLFLCTALGSAALLAACVRLALGFARRGRLFFCAALFLAVSLPMQQMPVQRWFSAAALLVGVCGWLWGRRFGTQAAAPRGT